MKSRTNMTTKRLVSTRVKYVMLTALLSIAGLNMYAQTEAVKPSRSFFTTFFGDPMNYLVICFLLLILLAIYGLARTGTGLAKLLLESKKKISIISLLLLNTSVFSQTDSTATASTGLTGSMSTTHVIIFIILFAIMIYVIYALYHANMTLIKILYPKTSEAETVTEGVTAKERKPSWIRKVYLKLVDSVPVIKEKDILLDHDYDGIHELDNNLPPWWKYGFYVTIIFAFVYLIAYHVTGSAKLQVAEYEEELNIAKQQKEERMRTQADFVTEENVTALLDADALERGKEIFQKNCVACHRADGGGQVGPNLTDEFWIHGGGVKNIFKVIHYGVPAKGMISWQAQLSPKQIQQVASYIITLKGSNPAGAKEPQGDKWTEETTTTAVDSVAPADTIIAAASASISK